MGDIEGMNVGVARDGAHRETREKKMLWGGGGDGCCRSLKLQALPQGHEGALLYFPSEELTVGGSCGLRGGWWWGEMNHCGDLLF